MRKLEEFLKPKRKKTETGAKKFLGMYKRRKLRIIVDKRIENYMPFFAPVSVCQINLNNRLLDKTNKKLLRLMQLFIVSNGIFIPASIYKGGKCSEKVSIFRKKISFFS